VRSIVLSARLQGIDFEDFEEHTDDDISTRMARTEALAKHLGKVVAGDPKLEAAGRSRLAAPPPCQTTPPAAFIRDR
jgi:hypothetical protein